MQTPGPATARPARDTTRRNRRWPRIAVPAAVAAVFALALLGPRVHPVRPVVRLPAVPAAPDALDRFVAEGERMAGRLRPDAQARIVWADPAHPAATGCALVYLHGFGASQAEGAPAHRTVARAFGCNLFLARLPGHGLAAPDAMRGLSAQALVDGAARALAIGRALGHRVVLVGTSTGGSLALVLASQVPVDGLVLWSPLVREHDNALWPLMWPWGPVLMRLEQGRVVHRPGSGPVWADALDTDGYRALAQLTRGAMVPPVFRAVRAPAFVGFYFRDAAHQDATVSVAAIRTMASALGTPPALERVEAFPDAGTHVIASGARSGAVPAVEAATCRFLREQVKLTQAGPPPADGGC